MKFAICNETFQDWPFERALLRPECGYTGIEIAPFTIPKNADEITAAQRAEVRAPGGTAGLEIVGLHWLLAKTEGFYLTSPDAAGARQDGRLLWASWPGSAPTWAAAVSCSARRSSGTCCRASRTTRPCGYAAEVIRRALPVLEACGARWPWNRSARRKAISCSLPTRPQLIELIGSPQCRLHLDVKAMSTEGTPDRADHSPARGACCTISTPTTPTGTARASARSISCRSSQALRESTTAVGSRSKCSTTHRASRPRPRQHHVSARLLAQSVQLVGNALAAHQIRLTLPGSYQMRRTVPHQHLGRQRLRVVVRAHHESVGPGALDHQQIADRGPGRRRGATKPPSSCVKMSPDSHSGPPTITSCSRRRVSPSAGTIDIG